jgi:hypothetical protein
LTFNGLHGVIPEDRALLCWTSPLVWRVRWTT